jgi:hypothetical protein
MTVDEFPIEIRHLMLYRQQEQKGKKNWSVFQNNRMAGFDWQLTPEKDEFWRAVINRENFDYPFYAKYPKVDYPKGMPEEIIMLALDRRVEQEWINGYILGFSWSKTPEMYHFWLDISCGNYKVYYEMYHSGRANNPCVEIPLSTTVSLSYGGQIKDFPPEIVEMMLQRQFEQTGKRDVSVFEDYGSAACHENGFSWSETPEHDKFWHDVITEKKFDVFYEKYPKKFNSHIKTKQNDKENTTSGTGIKVQRPVATITTRERCTTSGISGRRSPTAITSGHLSHKAVIGF